MGGTFGQDNFIAVKNDECGTLNISGGTITSKTQAVQNWCNANITGGTLTGSVTSWTYMSTQANTNISGGIINGDIQASQYNYTSKGQMVVAVNKPVVTLSGNVYMNGSFKIGVDTDDVFVEDLTAANVTITGGSYVNNPSVFLANGYVAVLTDGVYKVWDEDSLPVEPEVPEEPEEPEYPVLPELPDYVPEYGGNSGSSSKPETSKPETSEPETEWKRDDDGNTYFYKDGEKVTGWVEEDGEWYYMNEDTGAMTEESWVKVNNVWYAFDDDGHMLTGWQEIDGKWYYLKDCGGMATGWQQVDGKWYYLKGDGAMATGWVQSNGQWYYLKGNGAMATGWVESNGKWYYLYESGEMATNATIGGYYVNSNGEWVK
ncbi:MAG TPA: N-acetylmuramoyl-L-alanine amidase family protein [Candidatus Faecivivens stercoripullorum]|uniref:N-acetylmuramoyl-L-alanine amidase family protein n=1 Tax=Candidatus Faecivivens stercoripullorum TaxID=2840805 RepID=A0A9D1H527_9FIRM|nr:N-acetylmuramoyl-L-alanine amidase family protein [Candidatus Faecivivens stercoripullorum]